MGKLSNMAPPNDHSSYASCSSSRKAAEGRASVAEEERMAATDQDSWRKRELLSAHSWPSAAGDATHMQRHDPARRHRPRPETDAAQALRAPKRSRR